MENFYLISLGDQTGALFSYSLNDNAVFYSYILKNHLETIG